MDLSVIIPIYNEEANIGLLYNRLKGVLDGLPVESYEMVFINDGSRDASLALIKGLAVTDSNVRYIDFSRNFGHQVAVTAGLDACVGNAIVIIDADLQDPPELIGDLYAKHKEGYQVVYAQRRSRQGESFFKKFTAKMFYRILARITSVNIPVDTGDFRLIDRVIVNILKEMPEQQKYLRGQIAWIGFNQIAVEYDRDERNAGETGYTFKKMVRLALDGLTGFSNFPLRFATLAGFFVSGIAFLLIIYALISFFFFTKTTQPGWTSMMISVLFIGGIQLIGIGIIGEYIGRISSNVRNRPLYIVKDTNISSRL